MGSNVIFRFSFRSSLFIVYQYYTGCWFYFSYFLLYPLPEKNSPKQKKQDFVHSESSQANIAI